MKHGRCRSVTSPGQGNAVLALSRNVASHFSRMTKGRRLPSLPGWFEVPGRSELSGLTRHIELRAVWRWVGLGLAVGLLSGGAACLLYLGSEFVKHLVVHFGAGAVLREPHGEVSPFHGSAVARVGTTLRPWVLVIAPALGAFLSACVVYFCAPEAAGGNEGWLKSFHLGRGRIRLRVAATKLIAATLNLGGMASAGREGPIAHIGAALGAFVGSTLKLSDRERRVLLIAGAAGGIGAIFRTPLGGALFVVEVLYRDDLEAEALVPSVLASVVAYAFFTSIFGEGTLFSVSPSYSLDARELPIFGLMAVACGVVGVVFVRFHHFVHDGVQQWQLWPPLRALPVGLGVGLLSLLHPSALGAGYGWMQEALEPTGLIPLGWAGVRTLLLIVAVKVVATSLSAASGAAGGVFGPAVVIGGMVGGAFGLAFAQWFPEIVTDPSSFMLVGMACFIGGVSSAPISTLIMSCEMTGSYELLVPTMLAEVVTVTLIRGASLFREQRPARRDSPAHGGEYVLDVLAELTVKDVYVAAPVAVVARSVPLSVLLRRASETTQVVFPVSDDDGRPEGLVSLETIKAYLFDDQVGMLAIAADCESPFISVDVRDSLALALERMARFRYQQLPVLDGPGAAMVGLIAYEDLLQAYSRELSKRRLVVDEGVDSALAQHP